MGVVNRWNNSCLLFLATVIFEGCAAAQGAPNSSNRISDLQNLEQFRQIFNEEKGTPRLILLVSPTCLVCLDGTRRVQTEILEKFPSAKLRVYAIWVAAFPNDSKSRWRKNLLTDPRASHFWDDGKVLGNFYQEQFGLKQTETPGILWDVYVLYDAEAIWKDTPPKPVSWGYGVRPGIIALMPVLRPPLLH